MLRLYCLPGWHRAGLWLQRAVWLICLLAATPALAIIRCGICGQPPIDRVYVIVDKITEEKVNVCEDCQKRYHDCFLCGVPANTNRAGFKELEDGRVICGRDAETVVLELPEGTRTFRAARDSLNYQLSRFTSFPDTNIVLAMVDRIHLQELFTLAGNDYHCPNILGYTQTRTNDNRVEHYISLMTALPLSDLRCVCAHELAHAWVAENVSARRRRALDRDAEEGFCELMAFLYADSLGDEHAKKVIHKNRYTRGQAELFIAASQGFGQNDVLDWMKYGTDRRLSAAEPAGIRKVELPAQARKSAAPPAALYASRPQPQAAPTNLVLKAVFWDAKRPVALINNQSLGLNEEGKVRLGASNVTVRCLAIRPDAVRIQVNGRPEPEELKLKASSAPPKGL